MSQEQVLARVKASAPRRWLAIVMLAAVGVLLIAVAFVRPPALGWQIFLVVTGGLALWLCELLRRATEHAIELTETELRDSRGVCIVRVDDVIMVDRGVFAFKPSNGFLLKTRTPAARAWQPGMWWRLGRRVGIGGVTPGAQTKPMSEILSAMVAMRD